MEWLKSNGTVVAIVGTGIAIVIAIVHATWTVSGHMASVEAKVEANGTAIARLEVKVEANTAAIAQNAAAIAQNATAIAELSDQYTEHLRQHVAIAAIGLQGSE